MTRTPIAARRPNDITTKPGFMPGRRTAVAFLASVFLLCGGAVVAQAEVLGDGPVVASGYISEKRGSEDVDLGFGLVGWGWRMGGPERVVDALDQYGINFAWKVEGLAGMVYGDAESVEASVVPYFVLSPSSAGEWIPYLEGGVGLIYSDLRGFDLGSRILFSDNIGVGFAHDVEGANRWSLGYRLRHISHASLWADANDGMNTHFIVLSVER